MDAWEVKGASVTIGNRELTASQIAGVPGTPAGGVTGEVVYVGLGTAADYEGLDVKGKIVLVDHQLFFFWLDWPLSEATSQGAAGVIMTAGPDSLGYATYTQDSLMGQDGEADAGDVPLVFIARQDADWLKGQITARPVSATVESEVDATMAADGGTGYNVVAEIPGCVRNGERVIISAHQDAHLRPGIDDTGAVATVATIAKAMTMSGYHPRRTIVFLFTTSEEFGRQGTPYDWAYGAWYAIAKTHRDWPGKVAGMMNYELMAEAGAPLVAWSMPDLAPWLNRSIAANAELLPYGAAPRSPQSTISDAWSFTASGIPAVCFAAPGDGYIFSRYHTQYDDRPDFGYIGKIAKFSYRLERELDQRLLPLSLTASAESLSGSIDGQALLGAGADTAIAGNLMTAVTRFTRAATAGDTRLALIPPARQVAANTRLMAVEKRLLTTFTALDVYGSTIFPHEQVLRDVQGLNSAVAALRASPVDTSQALDALSGVGLTSLGRTFSHDVYVRKLARNAPDYPLLCWGGLGKLAPSLDLVPQCLLIEAGRYDVAASGLSDLRRSELAELNARLVKMTKAANEAAAAIDGIR